MCDTVVALGPATAAGVTLFAKNSDRPPDEPQDLEWTPPVDGRAATRVTHITVDGFDGFDGDTVGVLGSRPRWGWGYEHGVNQAGLAIGNERITTRLDPRPAPDALTGMDLVRLTLQRAVTAREGVERLTGLLERYGQGGTCQANGHRPYWSSFLLADPLDAWVVETSGTQWAAEQVVRSRAISNRTTIEAFDAVHRHPDVPVETMVDPRLAASRACLEAAPVTASALMNLLRSHDGPDGWSVCMHVPGVQQTTASIVVELPVGGRPTAWCLMGSPCRGAYLPVMVGQALGDVPAWERFAAVGDDETAWRSMVGLETELRGEVVSATRSMAAASRLLRQLGV